MDFSLFSTKALIQNEYNKFEKYDGNVDFVPDEFKAFYRGYNTACVEIEFNNGDVRFYSVFELTELQEEYAYLNAEFIFATCNSDPIFFNDGQVYTCPHGVREPKWEALNIKSLFLQDSNEPNNSPSEKPPAEEG